MRLVAIANSQRATNGPRFYFTQDSYTFLMTCASYMLLYFGFIVRVSERGHTEYRAGFEY